MKFNLVEDYDEEEEHDDDAALSSLPDKELLSFDAYVVPDVSTFYQEPIGTRRLSKPSFGGFAAKFINVSPFKVDLFWDNRSDGMFIASIEPFQAVGTATFASHTFFVRKQGNDKEKLKSFPMHKGINLYVYDAFELGHASDSTLSQKERDMHRLQSNNLAFAKIYRNFTGGRDWLALYPLKKKPIYPMWNADYFGQRHWVSTPQIQYLTEPPSNLLKTLSEREMRRRYNWNKKKTTDGDTASNNVTTTTRILNDEVDGPLAPYRSNETMLNLTLTVLSCSPRAFEIKNFLSHAEVDHIIHMATGIKLRVSSTSAGGGAKKNRNDKDKTRTSKNSWVERNRSPIIDTIYARAADLMRFDESLLRVRDHTEDTVYPINQIKHRGANGEYLQLVHYDKGEQYTAHHDFTYPLTRTEGQPERFATLLLYLNQDGLQGGYTAFPRYQNADTRGKLAVRPEVGKAVLFYDVLPDGNMDDFSQHAAEPIEKGEKWLINLWTWDPRRQY